MNNSYVLLCSEVKMFMFTHVWALHVSLTQRKAIALRWVIPSFEALDLQKLFISSVSPSIVSDQSHSNSDNVVIATGSSPYSCSCSKDYHAKESWSNCFWFECEVSFSCAAAERFAMVIDLRLRTPGKVANIFKSMWIVMLSPGASGPGCVCVSANTSVYGNNQASLLKTGGVSRCNGEIKLI